MPKRFGDEVSISSAWKIRFRLTRRLKKSWDAAESLRRPFFISNRAIRFFQSVSNNAKYRQCVFTRIPTHLRSGGYGGLPRLIMWRFFIRDMWSDSREP